MSLKFLTRSVRQRARIDAAIAAYTEWKAECVAVRNDYRRWARASATAESVAFHAYNAALDREEQAAKRYAVLTRRAGQLDELALALQIAESLNGCGGSLA